MRLRLLFTVCLLAPLFSSAQFVEEKKIGNPDVVVDDQTMEISVLDAATGEALSADLRIDGLLRKSIIMEDVVDTTFRIRTYRLFNISCVKEGYMYFAHKFWPDEKQKHIEKVALKPLKVGLKTDVRDITFLGDKTEIYSQSKDALEEIISFMELNPTVKIAIIGHVNGPDNKKSANFYRKASEKRAEAVVNYLIEKGGIDKSRLEAKGMGNTEMIYSKPVTDWQSEANRRIQIEVLSL